MTPKATTLQERMGFRDPDLGSPEHDALVLSLVKHKVAIGDFLVRGLYCYPKLHKRDDSLAGVADYEDLLLEAKDFVDQNPRCVLEHSVLNGKFVVGFIDALLRVSTRTVQQDDKYKPLRLGWDGFVFAIEVKPQIPSFGEVLRQIRHYQAQDALDSCEFAIFTNDCRFKEAFEEQGVICFSPREVVEFWKSKLKA